MTGPYWNGGKRPDSESSRRVTPLGEGAVSRYAAAVALQIYATRGEIMGSISSRWAFVSASFPLVCVVVALGLGGCGAGPASGKQSTEAAGSGTLRLALTGGSSGQQYRLRNARFTIDGPVHVVLDSESKPDAGALSTELAVGDYQVKVGGEWFLERLDAGGPVAVQATLSSANPATVHIGLDAVTALPFRFVTDRAEVSLGSGTLEISADVSERGLALLAGQLGGLGSGDGTGANARFFGLMGVVGDGAGHLYVADSYNATSRRVTLGTLGVSTIAGSPMLSGSECRLLLNAHSVLRLRRLPMLAGRADRWLMYA